MSASRSPSASITMWRGPRATSDFLRRVAQTWTHEAADSDAKFLGRDLKLMSVTQRPPIGVGAIVIPWNSPLMLATWNLGPCLAAGNTCVLKPSELAPLTSIALGEIANEAGLPPGVLNVVPGLGDAGAALVAHPGVDAVAFTGGVATGRRVMASAAESLKRVTLELGGKSPNLVFADANLKRTAAGVARSIYRSQGQSCVAGSRLLVDTKNRRRISRSARSGDSAPQDWRPARRRHRLRPADFGRASRAGAFLRRRRCRQWRETSRRRKDVPPNPRVDSTICRRCSTASMRTRAPCPRKSSGRY